MKYIRRFFMILLIAFSVSSVFAATSYEGKTSPDKKTFVVGFDVELSSLSLSDFGFSSNAVKDIEDKVEAISFIPIDKEIAGRKGTFESGEFHVYWKLLGSGSAFPELWLKQEGVLNNGNFPNVEVNWAVDIQSNEPGAQFVEALNTADFKVDGVMVYPTIQLTAVGGEDKLTKDASSFTLKLRTTDPYWEKPNTVYTSELWLIVKPN